MVETDDDYDDDPYGVNVPSSEAVEKDQEKKTQEKLELEPQYEKQDGIKFEFTGTLLIPAPGEMERLEREKPREMMSVVGSKPIVYVPEPITRFAKTRDDFRKVKMNGLDALRLRQRGQ